MKEFNLEEALAGKPVKLRDGRKAYVKCDLEDDGIGYEEHSRLFGFVVKNNEYESECSWSIKGRYFNEIFYYDEDIIGMWEEQQPRITLNLPAPLKEPREGMFYIEFGIISQSKWKKNEMLNNEQKAILARGGYYATPGDAQEWFDAMKNNRA